VSVLAVTALLALAPGRAHAQQAGGVTTLTRAQTEFTLEQAVAAGLRSNRNLRVEELELERAEEQVQEAYGGLFPDIDGTLTYQRNIMVPEAFLPAFIFDPNAPPDELIPVRFGADNQWTAGISINQPLFDGRVFIGVGAAGQFKMLQTEVVRGSAQQVATGVRLAYYNVLLAHEARRVTENSISRVEQTLRETQAMNRAGLTGSYDVLRLEVQLANLRPNLRRTANEIAQTERQLSLLMGDDQVERAGAMGALYLVDTGGNNDTANRALLDFVGFRGAEEATFDELFAAAMEMRSDIRQARLQKELEVVQVKLAKSELLPRLSAFFNFNLLAQENGALNFFGESPNQRTSTAVVGVQLEVPIFAGFERLNRVDQRRVELRKAETRLIDLEQQVRDDIETVAADLSEARARAEAQQRAVGEAQRGFEIITAQYLAGTSSRLEVTDAELALRQAEQNYALAVYDYLNAYATLDLAIGVVPMVDPVFQGSTRRADAGAGETGRDRGIDDTERAESAMGDRSGEGEGQ
jgi:outer membrane protein TolC